MIMCPEFHLNYLAESIKKGVENNDPDLTHLLKTCNRLLTAKQLARLKYLVHGD